MSKINCYDFTLIYVHMVNIIRSDDAEPAGEPRVYDISNIHVIARHTNLQRILRHAIIAMSFLINILHHISIV